MSEQSVDSGAKSQKPEKNESQSKGKAEGQGASLSILPQPADVGLMKDKVAASTGDTDADPGKDEDELASIDALILEKDTDEQTRLTKEDTLQLKREAEKGQSKNIVMELSLDMDEIMILYLSPSWTEVLGSDWQELLDAPICTFLTEEEVNVFRDATQRLQEDDQSTLELTFHIHSEFNPPSSIDDASSSQSELFTYIQGANHLGESGHFLKMIGRGMLIYDRMTSHPIRTMWVIQPYLGSDETSLSSSTSVMSVLSEGSEEEEVEGTDRDQECDEDAEVPNAVQEQDAAYHRMMAENAALHQQLMPLQEIRCNICERMIISLYFEKHSGICSEWHKIEMELQLCNDLLRELISHINTLKEPLVAQKAMLEEGSPVAKDLDDLNNLQSICRTALAISTPGNDADTADKVAKDPNTRTAIQSPASESRISEVFRWVVPVTSDTFIITASERVDVAIHHKTTLVQHMRKIAEEDERQRSRGYGLEEELAAQCNVEGVNVPQVVEQQASPVDAFPPQSPAELSRTASVSSGLGTGATSDSAESSATAVKLSKIDKHPVQALPRNQLGRTSEAVKESEGSEITQANQPSSGGQ
ncbi:hypothetical protein BGZ65_009347, partial [Modicella reniformis]